MSKRRDRGWLAVLTVCVAWLVGCTSAGPELLVDLRTDLVPDAEFARVRTELYESRPTNGEATLLDRRVVHAGAPDADYLAGRRVASFEGVQRGSRWLVVSLLDDAGDVVVRRPIIVEVTADTGVIVVITRDCVGVECPGAGDDVGALACLAGRCVDPRCHPQAREFCPPATCEADPDCAVPAACAAGACVDGTCLSSSLDAACPEGTFCDPVLGCRVADGLMPPDGEDAGAPVDAGPGGGECFRAECSVGNECELGLRTCDGTERCEVAGLAFPGVPCATGECDGAGGCRGLLLAAVSEGDGAGTVVSDPPGIECGADCSERFERGASVVLTALPDRGSSFLGWAGDCAGAEPSCAVDVAGPRTVSARFALERFDLTVRPIGDGAGRVTADVGSIDCGATCSDAYAFGTEVTLTAIPDAGSSFGGFGGACTGPTCRVRVSEVAEVTASFLLGTDILSVARTGAGGGRVTSAPAGIDCGAVCAAGFPTGTRVTLVPVPDPGSSFVGWSGACAGAGVCEVDVRGAVSVSAEFAPLPRALTVVLEGDGAGDVRSTPAGIDCGADCTEVYPDGAVVRLVASPATGSTFEGWTGGGCAGAGACTVTMDRAHAVRARFELRSWPVSVAADGTGRGVIGSSPAGLSCGGVCEASFLHGTSVALTATPADGSVFGGWMGGGCSGTGACVVTVEAAVTVRATFTLERHTVVVTRSGDGGGTVVGAPGLIDCGATCRDEVDHGTSVSLTASADAGSTFAGWGGACASAGMSPRCVVAVNDDASVTATFTLGSDVLSVSRLGTGAGRVTSSPAGIDCGADCAASFTSGERVTLTATPSAGSTLGPWGGACAGASGATCVVSVDGATSATVTFVLDTHTLTVTRAGTGTGTITSGAPGIDCGSDCTETYGYGAMVTLTATPDAGSTFAGFSGGGCSGTGSCLVSMTAARMVTATFTRDRHRLSVATGGTGDGSVSSSPAGIDCGRDCLEDYDSGTMVTLTATPAASSTFTGWAGGGCSGTMPCVVSMTTARTVTAQFTLRTHVVSVTRSGTGTGSVASTPSGISCGGDCTEAWTHGTSVTLAPTADASSTFAGWTGDCTGTGACLLDVTAPRDVVATFTLNRYTLGVTKLGSGAGTVSSSPAGITCGADCSEEYVHGTTVTLTASPGGGDVFGGWGGACSGIATTCMVTMSMARSVTATFVAGDNTLTVSRNGTGTGTVTSSPGGISCGSTCSADFTPGSMVTLTAAASADSTFTGWDAPGCPGTGDCTVTMDMSRTVTATFTLRTYSVVVTRAGTGTGNVTSSPVGISCGSDCTESYGHGTMLTLTASPTGGSGFAGWTGCDLVAGLDCSLVVTSARSVQAEFVARTWPLDVAIVGEGAGTVSSAPAGIACAPVCDADYDDGEVVTLTAMPEAGSTFGGWSGAGCSGTGACVVTMTAARSVTATFDAASDPMLTVVVIGLGGTVTSRDGGIACEPDCTETYVSGTMVDLTAVTLDGWVFAGFCGGGCTGSRPTCPLRLDQNTTIEAVFAPLGTCMLHVCQTGDGAGDIAWSPAPPLECRDRSCTHTAETCGEIFTLTGRPGFMSTFDGWFGDVCAGVEPCVVALEGAFVVEGAFSPMVEPVP